MEGEYQRRAISKSVLSKTKGGILGGSKGEHGGPKWVTRGGGMSKKRKAKVGKREGVKGGNAKGAFSMGIPKGFMATRGNTKGECQKVGLGFTKRVSVERKPRWARGCFVSYKLSPIIGLHVSSYTIKRCNHTN